LEKRGEGKSKRKKDFRQREFGMSPPKRSELGARGNVREKVETKKGL